MKKRWNILYKNVDPKTTAAIAKSASVSPLIALLLAVRGLTAESAPGFLTGGLAALHDPFLLKDMEKATARIRNAITNKEKITVYGDYDVDGISSVALLYSYLQNEGADCAFYIPDRETEGYGLGEAAIRRISADGTKLIITVDTGITACAETALAKSLGVDVIVTDHHSVGETLPDAVAVINPKRPDCPYPFKALAGAGVAFKLICALSGDTKRMVTEYADIAALATIADVVSLTDENRAISDLGLRKMRKMPSVGLAALFGKAAITPDALTAYQISFYAAPRLNAAGRMGSCLPAVRLLLTDSEAEASALADMLNAQNDARKNASNAIMDEALEMIEKGDYADKKVMVLAHEGWHHGIIGIIASKLSEKFYKTTILISTDGETGKGSGRAVPGMNLFDALSSAEPLLDRYGGHALAAGLTLPAKNVTALSEALNRYADKMLCEEETVPTIDVDAPLDISLPLLEVAKQVMRLEPFGAGNARPVFLLSDVTISSARTSKDHKHLFLRLFKKGAAVDCIAFGQGALAETLTRGEVVDILGELSINTYGGTETPQIILQDIRTKQ